MTRARVFAALAAMITALLLQATVIAPIALPIPVSLPAVLIAAVALVDGPGAGMAFGFSVGLLADLDSRHPAGILALCWLAVGLICGLAAGRATVRRDAAVAGAVCGAAALLATALLVLVHADGATAAEALRQWLPATLGDCLLALVVVPIVRGFLRVDSLRAAEPILADITGSMR